MYAGLIMGSLGLAIITRNECRLALAALLWFVLEQKVGSWQSNGCAGVGHRQEHCPVATARTAACLLLLDTPAGHTPATPATHSTLSSPTPARAHTPLQSAFEEKTLVERYGDTYKAYAAKVPKFFPFL